MQTILATFVLFAVVMGVMAFGSVLVGRPLKGSCGGPGSPDCSCESVEEAQSCSR